MPIEMAMLRRFIICFSAALLLSSTVFWRASSLLIIGSLPIFFIGYAISFAGASSIARHPLAWTASFVLIAAGYSWIFPYPMLEVGSAHALVGGSAFYLWNKFRPLNAENLADPPHKFISIEKRWGMVGRLTVSYIFASLIVLYLFSPILFDIADYDSIGFIVFFYSIAILFFSAAAVFVFAEKSTSSPFCWCASFVVALALFMLTAAAIGSAMSHWNAAEADLVYPFWTLSFGVLVGMMLLFALWMKWIPVRPDEMPSRRQEALNQTMGAPTEPS